MRPEFFTESLLQAHRRERLILQVLSALASNLSLENILNLVAEELACAFEAQACMFIPTEIYRSFASTMFLRESTKANISPEKMSELIQKALPSLPETILWSHPEVTLLTLMTEAEMPKSISGSSSKEQLQLLKEAGVTAVAIIPIIYGEDTAFGAFVLIYQAGPEDRDIPYHSESAIEQFKDTLNSISGPIAESFYIHHIRNSLERSLARERLVTQVMSIVGQSFNLNSILKRTAEQVGQYFDADRCVVMAYDTNNLQAPILSHEQYCVTDFVRPIQRPELPVDLIRWTIESQVFSETIPDHIAEKMRVFCQEFNIAAECGTQILYRGMPLGMIWLHRCTTNRGDRANESWNHKARMLLQAIAAQVGAAIYQANLFSDLQSARFSAEQANQHIRNFIAVLSHELRTPLHAIVTGSQLLLSGTQYLGALTTQQEEYIDLIEENGKHLHQLVNDLLDLAKIEAGKISIKHQLVEIPDLMDLSADMLRPLLDKKSQKLVLNIDPIAPKTLNGDSIRLKQVLCNLLANANKYSPEQATIFLTCSVEHTGSDSMMLFRVADQGPGIASIDLSTIFNPFEQGTQDPETATIGTGLGLTLAKKLVELHGGTLSLKTQDPKKETPGAVFEVRLPLGL